MRPLYLTLVASFITIQSAFALPKETPENGGDGVSAAAVIREMNLARQSPQLYATFVEVLRSRLQGDCLVLPNGTRVRMREGAGALNDAIKFLRSTQSRSALVVSRGLCRAAADHCADQASGRIGHGGNPASRISRYGNWGTLWGENISYGKSTAREIVLALIIDDGLPARKHRKNIFNPVFNYAGAAYGAHARYRSVCSIDFAGSYAERGETLVARNF